MLLGITSWKELDRSYLHFNAPPVVLPHSTSAFPLMAEGY